MKFNPVKRIRNSLFLKILILFTLVIIISLIIPRYTYRFFFHPKRFPAMQKHIINHARYIKDDLGSPPDIQKAERLSRETGIRMRIQTPDQKWTSHEDMIKFSDLNLPVFKEDHRISVGFSRYGLCVTFQENNDRILLVMRPRIQDIRNVAGIFALMVGIMVTVLIIFMYFILRWQLKPIRTLHEGVNQLSRGNINHQMSTRRGDELGTLVQSFNTMTGSIREMIRARERLLLDVSHELRSPLTRMKVALEFLDDSQAKTNIQNDINEVETKITELLETERLDSQYGKLKLGKTRIMKLIEETASEFRDRKPGIRLVDISEKPELKLDRERIRILLRNILDNALRYSSPGGKPVEISLEETGDELTVIIRDYGTGIPEKDLPLIFEPFYRVDKSRSKKTGGYGLGMSLSKKIMEAHGGHIKVSSRLKEGTIVSLIFRK